MTIQTVPSRETTLSFPEIQIIVDEFRKNTKIYQQIAKALIVKDRMIEHILCAAVDYYGLIVSGFRHKDCYDVIRRLIPMITEEDLPGREKQGFLTSKNRYVSREQAYLIAKERGQIIHYMYGDDEYCELISEDLY